jgi:hypothetical protein
MFNLILGFVLGVPVGGVIMIALIGLYFRSDKGSKVIADVMMKVYEKRMSER